MKEEQIIDILRAENQELSDANDRLEAENVILNEALAAALKYVVDLEKLLHAAARKQ